MRFMKTRYFLSFLVVLMTLLGVSVVEAQLGPPSFPSLRSDVAPLIMQGGHTAKPGEALRLAFDPPTDTVPAGLTLGHRLVIDGAKIGTPVQLTETPDGTFELPLPSLASGVYKIQAAVRWVIVDTTKWTCGSGGTVNCSEQVSSEFITLTIEASEPGPVPIPGGLRIITVTETTTDVDFRTGSVTRSTTNSNTRIVARK